METCAVVDQFCTSPANVEPPVPARGVCFACGEAVCAKCSTKRQYLRFGVKRICNTCQIEMDGNEDRVMERMNRLAGYPPGEWARYKKRWNIK